MKTLFAVLILSVLSFGQCTTNVAPKITSANVIAFTEGSTGSFTVTATGTPTPAISEVGSLPAGVTFSAGKISGTPALGTAGTFALTFVAQNGTAPDASQSFTLTVFAAQTTGFWVPTQGSSWSWWLSNVPPANNLPAQSIIDSDGFETPAATVVTMHAQGKHWVCYISAGTAENFRSDYGQFPASVKGKTNGWPGETWLDVRQTSILFPIMSARMSMCKQKGADAVELDNVDGAFNSTGFPLKAADQTTYNKGLADIAHSYGLSAALKNDSDQANALQPFFDFAIVEQALQYSETSSYQSFITAGKKIMGVEYKGSASTVCPKFAAIGWDGILTDLNVDGKQTSCR